MLQIGTQWRGIFLCSENQRQYECRQFLSIQKQNMALTQIHDCIFVPEKDTDQISPVWLIQHYAREALQHYILPTVTLKLFDQVTKCKIGGLVAGWVTSDPLVLISQWDKQEWDMENGVVSEVKLLPFTKKDEKFSIMGDCLIFSVTCNCLWLCCSHEIHKR